MRSLTSGKILSGLGLSALLLVGASLTLQGCDKSTEATPNPWDNDSSTLLLKTPRGGESFMVGDVMHVTWAEQGANAEFVTAVDVRLSPDDGRTWVYLNVGSIPKGSS